MIPETYQELREMYTQEKKLHEFHVNQLVEQLSPLIWLAEHYIVKEAHEATDRSDIESLKKLANSCYLDLDSEIEQIWEARKVEIQNDLNESINMHIELIRGC
jgi:uncharacterized protein (DUF342 family)